MRWGFAPSLIALLLLLTGCAPERRHDAGPLVLAAASLQEVLEAAADAWQAEGHARPVLSFAASSALARQVEAGAPGDLFISADEDWMDAVEEAGRIRPSTRSLLAGNSLVLVAPADFDFELKIDRGFPLAKALGNGRLAMADPDAVPAGRYGKEALVHLGVWSDVAGQIAVGENVRVALNFVSRKEAPLGIVYASDVQAEPGVRIVGYFPVRSHRPIRYPIAILAGSTHPDANAFREFLLSDRGQAIFRQFGFEPG